MRFKTLLVLPLALLALGSMTACSNDNDDDDQPGADAGTDGGSYSFPDAGADPGVSPTAACPAGAIHCDTFDGNNGWSASQENAQIRTEGGRLHILTMEGVNETVTPLAKAIAQWSRPIPAFGTQLFVRAHVYMTSLPRKFGQMGTFFVVMNLQQSDFGGFELQVMEDSGFALDDWTGVPDTGWRRQGPPVNLGMAAGRWVCLEWELRRPTASSNRGNARVYVDGTLAHDFPVGMRSFNQFLVGYGFVHPQGPSGSETWIDNLAISSTARIGCQ